MFANVGWGELMIIGLVALVVLGPERLPEAARWLAGVVRKVKQFASDAQTQLQDDFGADFDEIRKPLEEINQLRGLSPRSLVTKHLLDGDESLLTGKFGAATAAGGAAGPGAAGAAAAGGVGSSASTPARSTKDVFRQENARAAGAPGGVAGQPTSAGGYTEFDDAT